MPHRPVLFASLPTRPVLVLAVCSSSVAAAEGRLLSVRKTMSANTCSGEPDEVPDNEVNAHPGNPGMRTIAIRGHSSERKKSYARLPR